MKRYFVILLLWVCNHLYAQNFLKTESDRFLKSGDLYLSLQNTYLRNAVSFDYESTSKVLIVGPTFQARLGLGDHAEFESSWDILRYMKQDQSYTHDISDVSFFTKIKMIPETHLPSLNLRIGAKLPNASDETHVGTDLTDAYIWAVSGKQFGKLQTFSNMGVEIIGNPMGGQDDAFSYGLGMVYPFTSSWQMASEWVGRYFQPLSPINQSVLRLGTTVHYRAWQMDLGFSTGMISQSESWGTTFGITRQLHVFE